MKLTVYEANIKLRPMNTTDKYHIIWHFKMQKPYLCSYTWRESNGTEKMWKGYHNYILRYESWGLEILEEKS